MSLINDALKKAQKQRTGDSPPLAAMPGVGGESAAKIAKRGKPAGIDAQLTRLAVGAGGVLVLAIAVGFFVFRASHRHAAADGPKPAVTAEAPKTAEPAPAGAKPGKDGTAPAITFTLPIAPPAQPVSSITSSAGNETGPAGPAAITPASKPPEAAGPAPAKGEPAKPAVLAPAKFDTKSINFIESLRIAGIRASATDSKVLMNDRVYRIGDIVEHELGLKLIGITASSLTFEDERGARYTRSF